MAYLDRETDTHVVGLTGHIAQQDQGSIGTVLPEDPMTPIIDLIVKWHRLRAEAQVGGVGLPDRDLARLFDDPLSRLEQAMSVKTLRGPREISAALAFVLMNLRECRDYEPEQWDDRNELIYQLLCNARDALSTPQMRGQRAPVAANASDKSVAAAA